MRILLAVDGSACSDAATQALITRFRPEGAEVRVLHAVEWLKELPESFRFGEGPTYAQDIAARRQKSFQDAEHLVTRIAEQLRSAGFKTSTETLDGDPRRDIIDCAQKWHADLIMIGSHGRRGFDRFLMGSVAEAVMRHAACSVEIVRTPRTPA